MAGIKKWDNKCQGYGGKFDPHKRGANINWCSHSLKQSWSSSKIKPSVTIWSISSSPRYMPKKNTCWNKNLYMKFIAMLFIVARRWKHTKYPWTDEYINKTCFIHPMEYISAIKMNEQLIPATTQLSLFKKLCYINEVSHKNHRY